MVGFQAPMMEPVLEALLLPLALGDVRIPHDGRVLFLRAREGFALREAAGPGWLCQQSFKPFAQQLEQHRLTVGEPGGGERFGLVLVLPPRQRDEARAVFARAVHMAGASGIVMACVPNAEGSKSAQADLSALAGEVQHRSKHKCRIFWTRTLGQGVDAALLQTWLALDQPQRNSAGFLSRPGLFAWDRVDAASALLARHLPEDLGGHVADLGAGYGYLSTQLLQRCPGVTAIDMYEAEARALQPARENVLEAMQSLGREPRIGTYWHDVTQGLPAKYDAIISNPPFHQGRADLPELGRAFIMAAAQALQPQGRFWLVANRHLPYESVLAAHFNQVRSVVVEDGFKVIEAMGVRR